MKVKYILGYIILTLILTDCQSESVSADNNCNELPKFIVEKNGSSNDSIFIIKCYLDDNSIYQYRDKEMDVNITPIFTNKNNNKILFVDREKIVAIDTVTINNDKDSIIYYSIKFPSPKGGDIELSRGVKIK